MTNIVRLTFANIDGLKRGPHFIKDKCYWCWEISLNDSPLSHLDTFTLLYLGASESQATAAFNTISNQFKKMRIYDEDKVAVIYDKDGIIAIGRNGWDNWLHLRGDLQIKTFKELNLNFDSFIPIYY